MTDTTNPVKKSKVLGKKAKTNSSVNNKQEYVYHVSKNIEIQDDNNKLLRQLTLFTHDNTESTYKSGDEKSNAIEIWDVLPKYSTNENTLVQVGELKNPVAIRETTIYGQVYRTSIIPAQLNRNETKSGEIEWHYPSKREMYVEEALMKLAVFGSANADTKFVGVKFTLTELIEELKRNKHTLSLQQLKEALMICHRSRIEVHTEDGRNIVSATIFPMMGLTSREDYLANAQADATCYVQFNQLVTVSIQTLTFRQYNYSKSMSLTKGLSNPIYKRLVLHWTQASSADPYTFKMSTMLENSSRMTVKNSQSDRRLMYSTLEQLKLHRILADEHSEVVIKEGRKIVDIKFTVYPHEEFIEEVIQANQVQKRNKEIFSFNNGISKLKELAKAK